jgi:hypothetical protein
VQGSASAQLWIRSKGKTRTYIAEIQDAVIYVHPKVMKASTLSALELRMPSFDTVKPIGAQEIGMNLWMNIRAMLVLQESSMFSGGFQRDAETVPSFHLSRPRVHNVLDHVVALWQGGVWIMYQVPSNWQADPKTQPFDILSYSGDQQAAELIKCSEAK